MAYRRDDQYMATECPFFLVQIVSYYWFAFTPSKIFESIISKISIAKRKAATNEKNTRF